MTRYVYPPSIIDVEASGFGPHSYPIEVGVVKGNGDRYCSLIRPEPDWTEWSEDAESLHGISREVLQRKGKSIQQVCAELNHFLLDETVYSDAIGHDQRWLMRLFYSAEIIQHFKVSAIETITSLGQLEVWDETRLQVQTELGLARHRASSDALLIQRIYVAAANAAL
jgi:hypothetical protein